MNQFWPVEDGRLWYELAGKGEPVVFIHGFSLDHRMWRPQIESFSTQYQILNYDARGFGQSSLPVGPYAHHEDLFRLITGLNLGPTHIVGLSMGGRIAANFTLLHPGLVKSLTLIDAAMNGYQNAINWEVYAKSQGTAAAKRNWLQHQLFEFTNTQPEVAEFCAEIVNDYSGWHWINDDPQSETEPDTIHRLNEITAPTLVAVGEHDLPQFHDIAHRYHEGIANSHLEVIHQSGHMVNLESPRMMNQLLEQQFTI